MNITNFNNNSKWNTFIFNLHNHIISNESIELAVDSFLYNKLSKLDDDEYILVIFRVVTSDKLFRNISVVQTINKNDRDILKDNFIQYWSLKADNYQQLSIINIIFNYRIIDSKSDINKTIIHQPKQETVSPNILKFGCFNFPCTMDLYSWGGVYFINNDTEAIV